MSTLDSLIFSSIFLDLLLLRGFKICCPIPYYSVLVLVSKMLRLKLFFKKEQNEPECGDNLAGPVNKHPFDDIGFGLTNRQFYFSQIVFCYKYLRFVVQFSINLSSIKLVRFSAASFPTFAERISKSLVIEMMLIIIIYDTKK